MATAVAVERDDPSDDFPVAGPSAPEPNPIAGLVRAMRGRWKATVCGAALLGPALATAGFLSGVELYSSQAILRVFPQESNILYATGDDSVLKTFDSFVKAETTYVASNDDSVLKTFDSFVKAETTYVASNPVMERAAATLRTGNPDLAADLKATDLTGSIEIKRSDSLIVLSPSSARSSTPTWRSRPRPTPRAPPCASTNCACARPTSLHVCRACARASSRWGASSAATRS